MRVIYVVNKSTTTADNEVRDWCAAATAQLAQASAVWGRPAARVKLVRSRLFVPPLAWVILVMDDADQAGALGYHTVDRFGRVYGKVFARTASQYGEIPSVTFSHEVLETWGDPGVNLHADTGQGYRVPVELCDAVEGDSYSLRIGDRSVKVSNYLYPAWFGRTNVNGAANRDAMDTTPGPFELAAGGYTVRVFGDGRTDQVFGEAANFEYIQAKRHALSRTVRRSSGH